MSSSEAAKGRLPRYSFIVFKLKNEVRTEIPIELHNARLAGLFAIARID
jgi:hypothetical protein